MIVSDLEIILSSRWSTLIWILIQIKVLHLLSSHRMVDINGELANKSRIYHLTQNMTNWPLFKILFWQKEECLHGESIAGVGVTNAWDHPYNTSHFTCK